MLFEHSTQSFISISNIYFLILSNPVCFPKTEPASMGIHPILTEEGSVSLQLCIENMHIILMTSL